MSEPEIIRGDTAIIKAGGEPSALSTQVNVQSLMERALASGPDGVASLEKLVELQERMEDRAAVREFNSALAAFQADCPSIPHSRKSHNSTYTELDVLATALRPHLERHGFSYSFDCEDETGAKVVVCVLRHIGGHSERTTFRASVDRKARGMNETQQDVSAWSYGRRISLQSALGVTTTPRQDEPPSDDDGNAAGSVPVNEEQAQLIRDWIASSGADEARFLRWVSQRCGRTVSSVDEIPASNLNDCVAALREKGAKQ